MAFANSSHSKQFSLIFLPESLKDTLSIKGWTILLGLFLWEGFSLLRPVRRIDHAGHLGGLIVGLLSAQMMETQERGDRGRRYDNPLHAVYNDLSSGVSAYLAGDEKKLQAAKKGRGGDVGVE